MACQKVCKQGRDDIISGVGTVAAVAALAAILFGRQGGQSASSLHQSVT